MILASIKTYLFGECLIILHAAKLLIHDCLKISYTYIILKHSKCWKDLREKCCFVYIATIYSSRIYCMHVANNYVRHLAAWIGLGWFHYSTVYTYTRDRG